MFCHTIDTQLGNLPPAAPVQVLHMKCEVLDLELFPAQSGAEGVDEELVADGSLFSRPACSSVTWLALLVTLAAFGPP